MNVADAPCRLWLSVTSTDQIGVGSSFCNEVHVFQVVNVPHLACRLASRCSQSHCSSPISHATVFWCVRSGRSSRPCCWRLHLRPPHPVCSAVCLRVTRQCRSGAYHTLRRGALTSDAIADAKLRRRLGSLHGLPVYEDYVIDPPHHASDRRARVALPRHR